MVVKGKLGRRRYILFKVFSGKQVQTGDLIRGLVHYSGKREIDRSRAKPWLISFQEGIPGYGILRCTHWFQQDYIDILNSMEKLLYKEVKVTTLKTSGTLKTVREELKRINQEEEAKNECQ